MIQAWKLSYKPKGQPKAAAKVFATAYTLEEAFRLSGQKALKGFWVSITEVEEPEPNRWD